MIQKVLQYYIMPLHMVTSIWLGFYFQREFKVQVSRVYTLRWAYREVPLLTNFWSSNVGRFRPKWTIFGLEWTKITDKFADENTVPLDLAMKL